ncbi:hypothetical protein [Flavobacterium sp.]|uniref:hypothetical protein n=1 Tax=Flavobacterium sp. TaxID=239 RepID=UPI004047F79E
MKNSILIVLLLSLSSCSINGGFQGLYSYYKKTKKENPNLFVNSNDLECNDFERNKINVLTGNKILSCIKNDERALVYIWAPKCKNQYCFPLEVIQQKCNENDVKLYVVSEYYDLNLMEEKYNLENPIFGIDTEYYKTNLTDKYLKKFIFDLTRDENIYSRFYCFKNGVFKKSFDSIDTINYLGMYD